MVKCLSLLMLGDPGNEATKYIHSLGAYSVRWCVTSKYVHTIQALQIQLDDKVDRASLETFLELTVHST